MTVGELKRDLEDYEEDLEIRFAIEPNGEPYVILSIYNTALTLWIDAKKIDNLTLRLLLEQEMRLLEKEYIEEEKK